MAKTKILIVEDESIVAQDIKMSLQDLGYDVCAVLASGKEAVKIAEENMPSLVLMDIVLKGEMDGVEAAEQIRSRFNIPVVYLTAYADEEIMERAKITEPYGYILKPFEDRELQSNIEIALYKHNMERKLKESEEWLSTTLRSIGDAVIATDTEGRIDFMNPVAQSLTGWKQEEATGKPLEDVFNIIDEETDEKIEDTVAKVLREDIVFEFANRTVLIAKDGTKRFINHTSAPIRDEKGNITGIVLTFRDVTERKRAEQLLQGLNQAALAMQKALTHEEIFSAVAEEFKKIGFSCMFFPIDESQSKLSTKYMSYDSSALKTAEKLVGIKHEDFLISIDTVNTYKKVVREKKTVFEESSSEIVKEVLPKPVKIFAEQIVSILRVSQFIATPLITDDKVIGVFSVQSNDLTEKDIPGIKAFANQMSVVWHKAQLMQDLKNSLEKRKRIQNQLIQSEKMVALGILSAGVVHEVNNPLSIISGYVQILLMEENIDTEVKETLEIIEKQIDKVSEIIDQLLQFSKNTNPKITEVNLNESLEEALSLLKHQLSLGNIKVVTHLSPRNPSISGDIGQLQQVFLNLMINASEAMPEGGKLTVSTGVKGSSVEIRFTDTGCGIPEEKLSRLFEPFFTTSEQGKGLGLSVAHGIIESHGGTIEVKSKVEEGTTFIIKLPVKG